MTPGCPVLANERGFALASVIILFVLLLTLGAAGMVYTTLDLRSTNHYDTGNQALYAAESGVLSALSTMNATGVIDFQRDIVEHWGPMYGEARKTIPGDPAVSHQVAIAADPTDPANRGTITATGFAPLQARRVIRVAIRRGGFSGSPGAVYLASDAAQSQFTGDGFDVDGSDHDAFGVPVAGGPLKVGIATRNEAVTGEVTSHLSDQQKDNVKGLGFRSNPLTPSVLTTGGASLGDLDQIISNILNHAGVATSSESNWNGSAVIGTFATPQITHLTSSDVFVNGELEGAGILVVDGSLTISGTMDFIGWVIVRGKTVINAVSGTDDDEHRAPIGNATVFGSLWTGHLEIRVAGTAIVNYCHECMRLVDNFDNTGLTPRPMAVVYWQELL